MVIELTNKAAEHAVKCLLFSIVKVEVEVENGRRRRYTIKILNNSGAKNCLATSRNAVKP